MPNQQWKDHRATDGKGGLRTFHAAVAGRASDPIDILFSGDSVTEGAGASAREAKWVSLVRDALRAKYQPAGIAGGEGYSPAFTYYDNPWSYSGSHTQPSTHGLGFLGVTLAASASMTRTFTGTALDVFVTKLAGAGTVTVSVDGASSGTGFATYSAANASTIYGHVTRVGGLAAGEHTVTITASTASVIVEGAMIYSGDETRGIRTWSNAHSGYIATQFSNNLQPWSGAISAVQPDLMVWKLGINDWRTSTSIGYPSAYLTAMRQAIAQARSKCTIAPSVLIIAPYMAATGTNTGAFGGMQHFVDAAHKIADRDPDCEVLDLFARSGRNGFQAQQMGLLAGDNIHPSDKGHQWMADAVLGKLAA